MGTLWQDLRYGLRMMLKRPGFTVLATLTLALGIGANTAIFSVVNAVLLRPLPYSEPQRLVWMESVKTQAGPEGRAGVAPADFWDLKGQSRTLQQLAAYRGEGLSLKDLERPEVLESARVTANFFETFGAQPILGRAFTPDDERLGSQEAVVISYRLWQRRFGGDPSIIGKSFTTTEGAETIVGVMPPEFKFPSFAEAWVPFSPQSGEMRTRAARYLQVFGRIREGQSLESAQAELATLASRLEAEHPDSNKSWTVKLTPFKERLTGDTRPALLVLLGAVGFVLLIACANVANLLLARADARRKEMAIRLALGASRTRLIRQLLTESVLLALLGGAFGLLLAAWGVDALIGFLPPAKEAYRLPSDVRMDGAVLAFTLLVSVLTGVLFGLVPGWQASRPNVNEWLKGGGHTSGAARSGRARGVLVVLEMALALVLLTGSGLLLQSFVRLRRVSLGYDPRGLLTMSVAPPFVKYRTDEARTLLYSRVLEETARVPGVESVALTSGVPFGFLHFPFNIEGDPLPSGDATIHYSSISPGYFNVLKAQMRAGRDFDPRDDARAPAVAIINEALSRAYFAGRNPLGQKISVNYMGRRVVREVVGVASDIKQEEPAAPVEPEVYVPVSQQPWLSQQLVIRTLSPDPLSVKADVQRAIWKVDQDQPVSHAETMEHMLSDLVAEPRLYTLLLAVFAGLALVLSAVGIYGVISYTVTQRTHEIGIRMALGAQGRDVLRMVLAQAMKWTLLGVGVGLAVALLLTRLMKSLLFGVTATDPLTFAAVSALLILVAVLACYVPARRATKVDPMEALRYE